MNEERNNNSENNYNENNHSVNNHSENNNNQNKPKKFGAYPFVPIVIGASILFTVVYSYLTVDYEYPGAVFMSTFLPRIILGLILLFIGLRKVLRQYGQK